MAPFRSSRSTRNNDPATLNRGRGGVIDHDPTEGLPVRNWYLGNVSIKQDEPVAHEEDQQANVNANTINPDYPWLELRLPSFYSELPPLSQQIVRIARSGRPVKPSVYDKKTGTYISHAEYSARNTLKSKHLENVDSPAAAAAADDDEDMDDDPDAKADTEEKERVFSMRKWAQVPPAVADRRPEPKYLADRRPGMRSLYGLQAAALNPALNVASTDMTTAGLDLGDGSGLGNATGVLAAGAEMAPMAVTPQKRMPPKRKKKGGPGRKKANLGPGTQAPDGSTGITADGAHGEGDASQGLDGDAVKTEGDTNMDDAHDDGSGSEEEGSEEGEIEEPHAAEVDAEMKTEEPVVQPENTIMERDEPAIQLEEPAIQPVEPPTIAASEEVLSSEPAPTPAELTESSESATLKHADSPKVDFLGSLDNVVADMEQKEE